MYTITVNPQFNSTEVTFDSKPSDAIRDALKGLHFRWHHQKGLWYGRAAAEEVSAILEGLTAPEGKAKTKAAKSQKQDHIRIYWNGLKVDGGLIQHIRTIAEWELTHEWNGKQKVHPNKTNDRLELANWLSQFVA